MTWRIIHSPHWEGCTHLSDARLPTIIYAYEEVDGARFVCQTDNGEVCFYLADERVAWLVSTDLEFVEPHNDRYLREPYEVRSDDDAERFVEEFYKTENREPTDDEVAKFRENEGK